MVTFPWNTWALLVFFSVKASASTIKKDSTKDLVVNKAAFIDEKRETELPRVKPDKWVRRTVDPKVEALMPKPRYGRKFFFFHYHLKNCSHGLSIRSFCFVIARRYLPCIYHFRHFSSLGKFLSLQQQCGPKFHFRCRAWAAIARRQL